MKKRLLSMMLAFSILTTIPMTKVSAVNFSKNESYYLKLCSSKALTSSQKTTCKDFSSYLKKKANTLKDSLSSQKNKISSTKVKINKSAKTLDEINSNISAIQGEIRTATKKSDKIHNQIKAKKASIKKLVSTIEKKEQKIADQMYQMQSTYNSSSFLNYLLNAKSISDIYSRVSSIKEITQADNEEIETLQVQKKLLKSQQKDLEAKEAQAKAQENKLKSLRSKLSTQRKNQAALLKNQQNTLSNQEDKLDKTESNINKITAAQKEIDKNLAKLITQATNSSTSSSSGVSSEAKRNKIVSTALTKLGCHYYWGGCHTSSQITSKSTKLFDCSGLVNWTLYHAGFGYYNRTSGGYTSGGSSVSYSKMEPGDIITFKYSGSSSVQHVGIYVGVVNGKRSMINALGEGSSCRPGNCSKNDAGSHAVVISSIEPGTTFYNSIYTIRRW